MQQPAATKSPQTQTKTGGRCITFAVLYNGNWENRIKSYSKGLTIIRADQCPYTVKNVNEICETAKNRYKANPTVITLENCKEAQNSPAPFGTFCILYDGAIIAEHPISNTRFKNIMSKIVK